MNRPRLGLRYAAPVVPTVVKDGIDPDVPIAGFYRFKFVTGGHPVAVRLWFGAPIEPWTGEEMDRAVERDDAAGYDRWRRIAEVIVAARGRRYPVMEAEEDPPVETVLRIRARAIFAPA